MKKLLQLHGTGYEVYLEGGEAGETVRAEARVDALGGDIVNQGVVGDSQIADTVMQVGRILVQSYLMG